MILWDTFYAASGESKYSVKIDREREVLILKGCEVSVINTLGSLAEPLLSTIWPKDWSSIAKLGCLEPPEKEPALRSKILKLSIWHAGATRRRTTRD